MGWDGMGGQIPRGRAGNQNIKPRTLMLSSKWPGICSTFRIILRSAPAVPAAPAIFPSSSCVTRPIFSLTSSTLRWRQPKKEEKKSEEAGCEQKGASLGAAFDDE